jgi:hypothetical protein
MEARGAFESVKHGGSRPHRVQGRHSGRSRYQAHHQACTAWQGSGAQNTTGMAVVGLAMIARLRRGARGIEVEVVWVVWVGGLRMAFMAMGASSGIFCPGPVNAERVERLRCPALCTVFHQTFRYTLREAVERRKIVGHTAHREGRRQTLQGHSRGDEPGKQQATAFENHKKSIITRDPTRLPAPRAGRLVPAPCGSPFIPHTLNPIARWP